MYYFYYGKCLKGRFVVKNVHCDMLRAGLMRLCKKFFTLDRLAPQ